MGAPTSSFSPRDERSHLTLVTTAPSSLRPTFHRDAPPSFRAAKPFSANRAKSAFVTPTLILPSMIAMVAGVTP